VIGLESEFVEVELEMVTVESRIGRVLAVGKRIDFGNWVGTLGAYYPWLKVVVRRGTFCVAVNDYSSLVAYVDSVGVSHQ